MTESHPDRNAAPNAGTSRRQFLVQSAAVAGAAAMLGACAGTGSGRIGLASSERAPKALPRVPLAENEPIRIGLIGPGGMGTGHVNAMLNAKQKATVNLQLVALCDVCQPRMDKALAACAEKQPEVKVDTYARHEDLLARDDIHAVLIATPEHWHAQHVIDAVAAGKDVYCEKPMTLNLPDALRVRQAVLANPDLIVQIGTQQMMRPKFSAARKLIADGVIGKPTFSQTSYCRNSHDGEWLYKIDPAWDPTSNLDWDRWCGPAGKHDYSPELYIQWRRYRDFSTGIVGDLLVHVMTPIMYALDVGWPTRVTASGGHYVFPDMENHDQVNLTVEFETGHTMIVAGSVCNETGLEVMIRGHRANINLGGDDCVMKPERVFVDDVDEQQIASPDIGSDHEALRHDWYHSIRTRQPNRSQVELATQVMVIVDLATRSMWEGHAYRFDPKTLTARAV
ncbi:MAG: Gfo/Idh/MocA family oxidoreductase [Phycisphaeraceae bacterium]|nr:Gfo/Idh/MocA family oxidoreductase [Phycisphaeraceae bacterium]